MKIAIFFINIGFYHKARLEAALEACDEHGWSLEAVQLTDNVLEHKWGNASLGTIVPTHTLVPTSDISKRKQNMAGLPHVSRKTIGACFGSISPDIIFLPGWSNPTVLKIQRWARNRNIPTVLMSESKRDDRARRWWKEKLKSWLYVRKFDAALVGGDAHADYALELGIPKNKIFRGYDCVDNSYFEQSANVARANSAHTRNENPKMPKGPYFLSAFRFMPRKNALRLVKAYSQYRNHVSDPWDLVIGGDGGQADDIKQSVYSQKLSNYVHLVGFLDYKEVGCWFGLAEALVHPALQEQWGLVINEACAAALPVLCSNTVGAAKHLVRDLENGVLFDPKIVDEITNAMVKMHRHTETDRRNMGQLGRHLVAEFSPAQFGNGVIKAARAASN